ncbi:MAG: nodulation protein NfeD [Candidatus Magnetoovum sp. WYHC-5]|nr:nodulation protein NfeD [Candidatus Magnetoovum sp. WYHC-5]
MVIKVAGAINPVSAEFIEKKIEKVKDSNHYEAIVIELDTPGGLDTSMRTIVKAINQSNVPVVVYVSPSGARAASAGVFITMSAHVAAMAPGTNIGAAHPVNISGQAADNNMVAKVTNDAVAYIKSIAEKRGRNVEWAKSSVINSVSVTDTEALHLNVIDYRAESLQDLLNKINGKTVNIAGVDKRINTSDATIIKEEMGLRLSLLNLISEPNIAYMLLIIGFYGIFFELATPGAILPGVIGSISLILGFYALQTMPVNYAGLLLLVLGIVLFILEALIVSYGVLTIGGIISMTIGSLMLFDVGSPYIKLSISLVIVTVILTAVFFIVIVAMVYSSWKKKPVTGKEGLIGMTGVARTNINKDNEGLVFVHGEIWSAKCNQSIEKGQEVVVDEVVGMKVQVSLKQLK